MLYEFEAKWVIVAKILQMRITLLKTEPSVWRRLLVPDNISFRKENIKFGYDYDFGDGWRHEVVVEEILSVDPNQKYPFCSAGENECPPEDCGGPWGFENFKSAMADPNHPDHE
ncbi:MAG: hypothetical protein COT73_01140 [Bdellovibrio sp. CG10_big_fil_rev_8_21_14_0_10_47_8]|nr:MAG: hypothetical protein COT73_01140 [Bdellovibrio sp. CG10_big_fil_rev_8_21_14_0_10_47_8]